MMECPRCTKENISFILEGNLGLAMCPDCGYSRAHSVSGLYFEVLFDWCEYQGFTNPTSRPKTTEELEECQKIIREGYTES